MTHTVVPAWYNRPGYIKTMASMIIKVIYMRHLKMKVVCLFVLFYFILHYIILYYIISYYAT